MARENPPLDVTNNLATTEDRVRRAIVTKPLLERPTLDVMARENPPLDVTNNLATTEDPPLVAAGPGGPPLGMVDSLLWRTSFFIRTNFGSLVSYIEWYASWRSPQPIASCLLESQRCS